jgi:Ser-tRNA(Ala) deacylase AlaX
MLVLILFLALSTLTLQATYKNMIIEKVIHKSKEPKYSMLNEMAVFSEVLNEMFEELNKKIEKIEKMKACENIEKNETEKKEDKNLVKKFLTTRKDFQFLL